MNKLSCIFLVAVAVFVMAAAIGNRYNLNFKTDGMPLEVRFQVIVQHDGWPDQFYSDSYSQADSRSFHMDDYWTFEPGTHPFAGPRWVYHPTPLDRTDADLVINSIERR